jgi:hypothetical protein
VQPHLSPAVAQSQFSQHEQHLVAHSPLPQLPSLQQVSRQQPLLQHPLPQQPSLQHSVHLQADFVSQHPVAHSPFPQLPSLQQVSRQQPLLQHPLPQQPSLQHSVHLQAVDLQHVQLHSPGHVHSLPEQGQPFTQLQPSPAIARISIREAGRIFLNRK